MKWICFLRLSAPQFVHTIYGTNINDLYRNVLYNAVPCLKMLQWVAIAAQFGVPKRQKAYDFAFVFFSSQNNHYHVDFIRAWYISRFWGYLETFKVISPFKVY